MIEKHKASSRPHLFVGFQQHTNPGIDVPRLAMSNGFRQQIFVDVDGVGVIPHGELAVSNRAQQVRVTVPP